MTTLYRFFDADERLLYIGIADNVGITTHVNLTEPPGHRCERRDDQHRLRGWVEFQRKANA